MPALIPWYLYVLLSVCVLLRRNMCILAQNNATGTSVDKSGVVGAVPEQKLTYKKAIACENQKLYISCPDIYDKLQIYDTLYGRQDSSTCTHPKLPSSNNCTEQTTSVNNIVNDLCTGESQCEVSATNDFLAQSDTIICPNVYKYLKVTYRCLPENVIKSSTTVPNNVLTTFPNVPPNLPSNTGIPPPPYHTPLQCCYVVPDVGHPRQSAVDTVGATITRHVGGIQSVEERIVSQNNQVPQMSRVVEIIHQPSGQASSETFSINSPPATIPSSGQATPPVPPSGQQVSNTEQPVTNSGPPDASSRQPSTTTPSPGQPATNTGQPYAITTSSGQPANNSLQPTITPGLHLTTLLKKQAKGLGLTSLISIDPSHIGALENPSKKSLLPKPEKYKLHKPWVKRRVKRTRSAIKKYWKKVQNKDR